MKQQSLQQRSIREGESRFNEWTEYTRRVNTLAFSCHRSYSINRDSQQQKQYMDNRSQKVDREKMSKSKQFLQLISSQRQLSNNKMTKHKLIVQIMSKLTECSKIESRMEDLLRQVSLSMGRWQKIRRQQIVRFRLNSLQQVMNQKTQINEQTINYIHQFNNQYNHSEDDDQQVRIQHFNITDQYHHNSNKYHNHNNDRLREFQMENQQFINRNCDNGNYNLNDYDDHIQI